MRKFLLTTAALVSLTGAVNAMEAECFVVDPVTGLSKACTSDGSGNLSTSSVVQTIAVTITRPANTTAYAANTLISGVTFGNAAITTSPIQMIIPRVRINTNITTGWDQAVIRVRLWQGTTRPTYSNADGGAYAVIAGTANFVGSYDVTLNQFVDSAQGVGSASVTPAALFKGITSGSTQLWFDMQYVGTTSITPISGQTFSVTFETLN